MPGEAELPSWGRTGRGSRVDKAPFRGGGEKARSSPRRSVVHAGEEAKRGHWRELWSRAARRGRN